MKTKNSITNINEPGFPEKEKVEIETVEKPL